MKIGSMEKTLNKHKALYIIQLTLLAASIIALAYGTYRDWPEQTQNTPTQPPARFNGFHYLGPVKSK
jgi:hypothetical protein